MCLPGRERVNGSAEIWEGVWSSPTNSDSPELLLMGSHQSNVLWNANNYMVWSELWKLRWLIIPSCQADRNLDLA